jgi:D-sedoheptulose 7-phosphate isomerase
VVSFGHYLDDLTELVRRVDPQEVAALVDAIVDAHQHDRLVFIIGNGGSGANASHLCEDLGKGTLSDFENQRRLRVISLTDNVSYIMAWANDEGYERIFVEQLKNLAQPGALLIAISGSGNSPNVVKAVEYANANGLRSVAITGFDGGQLRQIADHGVHVPSDNMGAVEAVHGVLFHYLVDALYARFAQLSAQSGRIE